MKAAPKESTRYALIGVRYLFADFEQSAQALMAVPEWRTWYPRVTALSEGGHREILNIVD